MLVKCSIRLISALSLIIDPVRRYNWVEISVTSQVSPFLDSTLNFIVRVYPLFIFVANGCHFGDLITKPAPSIIRNWICTRPIEYFLEYGADNRLLSLSINYLFISRLIFAFSSYSRRPGVMRCDGAGALSLHPDVVILSGSDLC